MTLYRRSTWRWCSNQPTIPLMPGFGVSPYAFLPLFLWLFHWSWGMFYFGLFTMLLCIALAKFGFTLKRLAAYGKHVLRGKRIYARPWWYRKRFAPPGNRVGSLRSGVSYGDEGNEE